MDDIYIILAAIVAAITAISAYWLFNGTPDVGLDSRNKPRRPTRRP